MKFKPGDKIITAARHGWSLADIIGYIKSVNMGNQLPFYVEGFTKSGAPISCQFAEAELVLIEPIKCPEYLKISKISQ